MVSKKSFPKVRMRIVNFINFSPASSTWITYVVDRSFSLNTLGVVYNSQYWSCVSRIRKHA